MEQAKRSILPFDRLTGMHRRVILRKAGRIYHRKTGRHESAGKLEFCITMVIAVIYNESKFQPLYIF